MIEGYNTSNNFAKKSQTIEDSEFEDLNFLEKVGEK